jgi:lipopolysaccharide biosynthesis regulator YciM
MSGLDLTKVQKKIARQVIETGLVREFENGIDKIDRIIQQWKNKKSETKETYYEIYQTLTKFDKHIGWRYNDMKGSTYLNILAMQLADGVISIDDLQEFDQDIRDNIVLISRINEG